MKLDHIAFRNLKISKCNMRYRDPPPDIADILPSIRAKGVLQPLIVRPEDGKYGVIAGRRRWFCLRAVKDELGEVEPPPCAVMEEGDDAEAIEASLLENTARRDADPMREHETFVRLIKEGRTVEAIAATFGLTPTQVRQRLALGNLLPQIREAYRSEEIDDETARHLTLASPGQQRRWLRLFHEPQQYAPRGFQLKQWLLGGQSIPVRHALFRLADYTGQIIEDLFGEDRYFADADLFWALQNRAIAGKREALLKAGWPQVDILEIGQRFAQYEHVKTPKKKGGMVFIAVSHDGQVSLYEGWLSQKEARKRAKAEAREKDGPATAERPPAGSIVTQATQNYLDLHRHALVRHALLGAPQIGWRLAVAHMVAPSGNWRVDTDGQETRNAAIKASVENSPAQAAFIEEQRAIYGLLGWQEDDTCEGTASIFRKLLTLADDEVQRIAVFFMAASLRSGSEVVEEVGETLAIDPRARWTADDTFFDLVRDRATINALLAEVAGEAVAKANVAEKAKTQKQIIRDCLAGANGRTKIEDWVPGWMCFPSRSIGARSPTGATTDEAQAAA